MNIIVNVPKDKDPIPAKEIKKVTVLCLSDPAQREEYERLINSENVFVEKSETLFTADGKYFIAVFYTVVTQGGN